MEVDLAATLAAVNATSTTAGLEFKQPIVSTSTSDYKEASDNRYLAEDEC